MGSPVAIDTNTFSLHATCSRSAHQANDIDDNSTVQVYARFDVQVGNFLAVNVNQSLCNLLSQRNHELCRILHSWLRLVHDFLDVRLAVPAPADDAHVNESVQKQETTERTFVT